MLKKYFILLVFLMAVFIAYGGTLTGQFIWDDKTLILDNPLINDAHPWFDVVSSELYNTSGANYYRPILIASFVLNFLFFGLSPVGFHFVNIMLHFFVGYLFYIFLKKIKIRPFICMAAGLIFLVHPLHAQTVSYISGRADSLAAIFIFLSILLYMDSVYNTDRYIISLFCFILALLSKEVSFVLPILLIILDFLSGLNKKVCVKRVVPFLFTTVAYGFLRFGILNFSQGNPFVAKKGFELLSIGFVERFLLLIKSLVIYLGAFFVPLHLHMERLLQSEIIYISYWVGFLSFCVLVFYGARSIIQSDRNQSRIFIFFLFWFLIWLLPQSTLVFPKIIAEHFLYLPSMSLSFLLAFAISTIKKIFLKYILFVSVLLYFIFLTWQHNNDWLEELRFFERTVHYSPMSIRARDSLAALYFQDGRYGEAEGQYKHILRLAHDLKGQNGASLVESAAYYNLGILYDRTQRFDDALGAYNMAVAVNPAMSEAYNNIGIIYQRLGDADNAGEAFRRSIEINKFCYQAMNNLAQLYAQNDRLGEAVELWRAALVIYPGYESAIKNLAIAGELLKIKKD